MGLLDLLMSKRDERPAADAGGTEDDLAVRRYLYLLRTAPPETLERAHEEAFSRLTAAQRRQVLERLRQAVPAGEAASDDPKSLARVATRAEVREPGTLQRVLGGGVGGMGMGGMLAGGLLSSLAGSFLGTALAQHFLSGGAADAAGLGQNGDQESLHGTDDDRTAVSQDDTEYVDDDSDPSIDAEDGEYGDGSDLDIGGGFDDV